jgi:hypothetical protein
LTTPTAERSIETLNLAMQFIASLENSKTPFNINSGNTDNFRIEYIDDLNKPITPRAVFIKQ